MKHSTIALAALCLLAIFASSPLVAAPPAETRLFVAPQGSDADPGTEQKPFATIGRAQKAVQALLVAKKPDRPITVLLRGGVYRLTQPLVFTPADSGTKECPVTFAAYPGEKPILDGGRPISGFRANGKLWITTIPDVKDGKWRFSQLFVDGKRMPRARTPNDSDFRIARALPEKPQSQGQPAANARTSFQFKPGDLQRWSRLDDAMVVVYHSWETALLRIKSLDLEKHLVEFTGPSCWHFGYFGPHRPYYVENVYEALDAPGEWYLDRQTGQLSYFPLPGQQIDKVAAVAPTVEELVRFQGDPQRGSLVQYITLRGISLRHADWSLEPQGHSDPQAVCTLPATVTFKGAVGCALDRCEIAHVGKYGVWIREGSKECRVTGTHLYDLGAGGIRVGETAMPKSPAVEVGANLIDNNYIHHYGEVYAAGVGIYVGQSSDNRISHNEIHDGYYSGMSIGWDWGQTPTKAHRNVIEFNHIHHVMRFRLSDGGGIYTLGTSPGTVIRNNLIHDVFSAPEPTIAWGIYLDAETNQVLVENNLCYNIHTGGLMMHNGAFANVVRNNIFARAATHLIWRALPRGAPATFERNICYVTQGELFLPDGSPDVKSTWDHNLYWHPDGKELVFNNESLDDWRARGLDRHSIVADPKFLDPAHDDFRLAPDSPAIKQLGFRPFDTSKCGLYGDPAWVALPRKQRFAPTLMPKAPSSKPAPVAETFESYQPGDQPDGAHCSLGATPGPAIEVTTERAASGKKSLKVTDAAGLQHSWEPHFFYQPRFTSGTAKMRFKLYLESKSMPLLEWRTGGYPYKIGPSIRMEADGQMVANGKPLVRLPAGQWIDVQIVCPLGKAASGAYDLRVALPNQPAKSFAKLPCDPAFKNLSWVGFISLPNVRTAFFVDELYVELAR